MNKFNPKSKPSFIQPNIRNHIPSEIDTNDLINTLIIDIASGTQSLNKIKQYIIDNNLILNKAKANDNSSLLHNLLKDRRINEYELNKLIDFIEKHGGLYMSFDEKNITPLHLASKNKYLHIVQRLIQNGHNVNAKDYLGKTPLHYSVSGYNLFIDNPDKNCNELINTNHNVINIKPQHKDDEEICYMFDDDITLELIKSGSDINALDNERRSPLFDAVFSINKNGIKILKSNGADTNIKDIYNKSVFDYLNDVTLIFNKDINISFFNKIDENDIDEKRFIGEDNKKYSMNVQEIINNYLTKNQSKYDNNKINIEKYIKTIYRQLVKLSEIILNNKDNKDKNIKLNILNGILDDNEINNICKNNYYGKDIIKLITDELYKNCYNNIGNDDKIKINNILNNILIIICGKSLKDNNMNLEQEEIIKIINNIAIIIVNRCIKENYNIDNNNDIIIKIIDEITYLLIYMIDDLIVFSVILQNLISLNKEYVDIANILK